MNHNFASMNSDDPIIEIVNRIINGNVSFANAVSEIAQLEADAYSAGYDQGIEDHLRNQEQLKSKLEYDQLMNNDHFHIERLTDFDELENK